MFLVKSVLTMVHAKNYETVYNWMQKKPWPLFSGHGVFTSYSEWNKIFWYCTRFTYWILQSATQNMPFTGHTAWLFIWYSPVAKPITLHGLLEIISLHFSIVLSASMKFSPGGASPPTWLFQNPRWPPKYLRMSCNARLAWHRTFTMKYLGNGTS